MSRREASLDCKTRDGEREKAEGSCGSKFRRWLLHVIIVIMGQRALGKIVFDTTLAAKNWCRLVKLPFYFNVAQDTRRKGNSERVTSKDVDPSLANKRIQ